MNNLREFLLEYLKKQYNVSETVKKYAEKVLEQLEKGSICFELSAAEKEELEKEKSEAIGAQNQVRPLILDGERLYIQRYFEYQKRILDKIKILLENKKLHVITGGPGTGKTTSLANILKDRLNEKILLAAPTGKAALRMKESLALQGIEAQAKTLHRLLGYIPLSVNFSHTKENPLEADIIAIDECSMIDLQMMAKLLEAVGDTCDLYLLGDKNQLASVEAGSVFADICGKLEREYSDEIPNGKFETCPYEEKTKNYRAQNALGIADLSKQILSGEVKDFGNENVEFLEKLDLNNDWYNDLFNAKDEKTALNFLRTFQILCATKSGRNGCVKINEILCGSAKKKNAKYIPIIITENDYQQNLFNGDVGIKDEKSNLAYFENKEGAIPALTLPKHEPAFAITIHKSQGSEYDKVAVVYPDKKQEEELFTRELLYTAITRAKKRVILVGQPGTLITTMKKSIICPTMS